MRHHAVQGRRQWRKVHLAMDTATSDIRAAEFTSSSDGESPVLPALLAQIAEGEDIGTVTEDGAYDARRCHTAIIDLQATAIIRIRKNGRPWKNTARPRLPETKPSVPPGTTAWYAGSDGRDTTSEAGSRRRCHASGVN